MKTPQEIIETAQENKCSHFMVWNIQGGYSYYRCDKCNYIDGKKTFEEHTISLLQSDIEELEGMSNKWKRTILWKEHYRAGYNQALSDIIQKKQQQLKELTN